MAFPSLRLLPLVLLAACTSSHPLDGSWNQELAGGAAGMSITFDVKGTACMVHTAPRADGGGHDHVTGTYTYDAAAKTVTVKAKLMGDDKADTWTGKIGGEHLELSSADGKQKLTFHHGEHAPGH